MSRAAGHSTQRLTSQSSHAGQRSLLVIGTVVPLRSAAFLQSEKGLESSFISDHIRPYQTDDGGNIQPDIFICPFYITPWNICFSSHSAKPWPSAIIGSNLSRSVRGELTNTLVSRHTHQAGLSITTTYFIRERDPGRPPQSHI